MIEHHHSRYRRPEPQKEVHNELWSHLVYHAFNNTIFVDDAQRRLAARYITPHIGPIGQLFTELRNEVDAIYEAKLRGIDAWNRHVPPFTGLDNYPIGYCAEITEYTFDRIQELLDSGIDSTALTALRQFRSRGGYLHIVYTGCNCENGELVFQNAIQIGSFIFDNARGTGLRPTGLRIAVTPYENREYLNFENFESYCEVAQKYWKLRIFSTARYLPSLAPFYPLLMIYPSGELLLHPHPGLFHLNIFHGFHLAEEFLSSSPLAKKELPSQYENRLRRLLQRYTQGVFHFEPNHRHSAPYCEFWRERFMAALKAPQGTRLVEVCLADLNNLMQGASSIEAMWSNCI